MHLDRKAILSAAVVAALSQSSVTFADPKFWDGPANNLWNNAANWSGGEPGAADIAVFDGAASVQRSLIILGANRTVQTVEVQGVPSSGEYKFVSEGGVLTTSHLDVQTAAGSITFEGFKVNTTSMTVHTGATLNMITNNAQLNASHMFINGALNWTGGGLTTSNPSGINVDGGVMTVTAGGRGLANGTSLHVYNGGTFTTNNYFDIGSSADAGNGPTGTLSVSGAGSKFVQTAGLGAFWGHNAGDHAQVNISDGGLADLGAGVLIATNHGSADVLVQTGGELRVGTELQVGVLSGSLQTGAGGAPVRTGGNSSGGGGSQLNGASGGFANINIIGGTFSTTANTPATFGQGAAVNVTGGGLNLGGHTTFLPGSALNWSGGTMTLADGKTLAFDGGVGTFSSGPFWLLSNGSTLRITAGGSLTATIPTAIGTVVPGPASTGTLTVDGANSRITVSVPFPSVSDWGFRPGDAATVNFSNSGVGSYSAVRVGGNGGAGRVNIQSNARLNAGTFEAGRVSGGTSDGVRINVDGGTLHALAGTTLHSGALITYSAGSMSTGFTTMTNDARVNLTPGGNKVLRAGGLSMTDTSKIDLNDNDMIVGNLTTKAAVQSLVNAARNGGIWNGALGITSTAAKNATPKNRTLGVLSGAEYTSVGGTGTFSGQSYSPTDTLVKFTYYGDTDFNGTVNFDDYGRIDAGFNLNRTGWLNGDFDLNGSVNFDDYGLIDLAFNTQSGTLIRAMDYLEGEDRNLATMNTPELQVVVDHFNQFGNGYGQAFLSAVPEPTTVAVSVAIGSLTMLRRRRRQR